MYSFTQAEGNNETKTEMKPTPLVLEVVKEAVKDDTIEELDKTNSDDISGTGYRAPGYCVDMSKAHVAVGR